jgi:PAS domain-containing protein
MRNSGRPVAIPFADRQIPPVGEPMKQPASHAVPGRINSHPPRAAARSESQGRANGLSGDAGFAAVVDTGGEALLVVNAKGVIQRANPRAGEMLRSQASELVHADLGEFLLEPPRDEFLQLCVAPAVAKALSSVQGVLASGFPVRISFRAVLSGTQNLVLCLEEGSAVRRAEAKWLQVEAELTSVLDSIQTCTILLDAAGPIRFYIVRFGQYFGMERRQLQSLETFENLTELVAPRFRIPENFDTPWKSFAEGEGVPGHDELEMTRPTRRILERFARPVLDREGGAVGWLAGVVLRRHRRTANSIQAAADGKNGSGGAIGFRHRARIE